MFGNVTVKVNSRRHAIQFKMPAIWVIIADTLNLTLCHIHTYTQHTHTRKTLDRKVSVHSEKGKVRNQIIFWGVLYEKRNRWWHSGVKLRPQLIQETRISSKLALTVLMKVIKDHCAAIGNYNCTKRWTAFRDNEDKCVVRSLKDLLLANRSPEEAICRTAGLCWAQACKADGTEETGFEVRLQLCHRKARKGERYKLEEGNRAETGRRKREHVHKRA